MKVKVLPVGLLIENCYIVYNEDSKNCIIIDPGDEAEKISDFIEKQKCKPLGIILTHGHFDHIGAVKELQDKYDIKCFASESEREIINDGYKNLSIKYSDEPIEFIPEVLFNDGDEVVLEDIKFTVILTPGHTLGGASLYFKDEGFIMTGDTLFKNTVGRTDLPTSSFEDLMNSVNKKLMKLNDDIVVYPGHGSRTTIGIERRENSYVNS